MTIVYSFPPGTGGDHVCGLLSGQHEFNGKKVQPQGAIKDFEHLYKIGEITLDDYYRELHSMIDQRVPIIASHHTTFPGVDQLVKVRALWCDDTLTDAFIARDLLTNNFKKDVLPYINGNIQTILENSSLTNRYRWLEYIKHIQQHGMWHSSENVPWNWIPFNIDRIFDMSFVKDVYLLAHRLGLQPNLDRLTHTHRAWLDCNPRSNFTVRRAVRYLETTVR